MAAIVGRTALIDQLRSAWAQAQRGGGQVMVLLGDAGIGKSTVLAWLADHVGLAAHTVVCRGRDAAPPMSAAAECLAALDANDGPHPGAAELATEPDPLRAAELLRSGLEVTRPMALLIDDIHDADPASRTALNLALRRSSTSGLLVVVAGRKVPSAWRFSEGFHVEQLDGLPAEEAAEVLTAASASPINTEVARRLMQLADGNPLALAALPKALSADQLAGQARLPEDVPLVGDLHTAFTRQLPPEHSAARELLDVAAVSADDSWANLEALRPDGAENALAQLIDAGLVRLHAGRVQMRHPLLRTAAIRAMPQQRRRALNLEIAGLATLPAEVRLVHRARGTVGPDDDLVDALVDAAHVMRMRGGTDVAARALDRAVDLTGNADRRGLLRLEAAGLLGAAGEAMSARHRVEELLADPTCADLHVAATLLLATLEAVDGAPAVAWQRLAECQAIASPTELGMVHARTCLPLGMLGLVGQIVEHAEAAVEHSKPMTPEWTAARMTLAHATCARDEARANHLVDELIGDLDLEDVVPVDPTVGLHVGRALSIAERYDTAVATLTTLCTRLRGEGARSALAMAFGGLGETRIRSSRFDEAMVCRDEAVALSLATGQRAFAPFWLGMRARVRAIRGDNAAATEDLKLGFAISEEQNTFGARYFLLANAGLVALSTQRHTDAIEVLEECWLFEQTAGLLSPQLARWHADLVQAYVTCGRRTEAEPLLTHLTAVAATPGASRWTRATALRAAALMADDSAEALRLLEAALDAYDPDEDGFDRARTLQIVADLAADPARQESARTEALFAFRRLGAAPWAAQVSNPRPPPGLDSLTDTEQLVLAEVAKGLTNRQIAKTLQMSSKTVANHLYHTYRKLGVASRTEAARYLLLPDQL